MRNSHNNYFSFQQQRGRHQFQLGSWSLFSIGDDDIVVETYRNVPVVHITVFFCSE